MILLEQYSVKTRRNRYFYGYRWILISFIGSFIWLLSADALMAAEAVNEQVEMKRFPLSYIFTFLFLMLGPFKIIGPFAKITGSAESALMYRIALLSIGFSSAALLIAAVLGETILSSYNIPVPVLALSAGVILFLVALQSVLEQFTPHGEDAERGETKPGMNMALSPLAFPTIVTPYGIAALVVFITVSPDMQTKLMIGAIVLAIMLLNLLVMVMTRHILPVMRILLPILGAVLGVVQVALGLQIINNSLKALGIL